MAEGALALALLIGMQFLVAFLSVRSRHFAQAVRSEPTLLARDGVFCHDAMKRERITEDEALSAIRSAGGQEVGDVSYLVLESDGTIIPAQAAAGLTWQRRLALMMRAPDRREVENFIATEVQPALEQVARELSNRGRPASIQAEENGTIALRSPAEGVRDFLYGVSVASLPVANFAPLSAGKPAQRYEARTYFSSGGRGYNIMGLHRDQLIADVLAQFERYLHLTHAPASQLLHSALEHKLDE